MSRDSGLIGIVIVAHGGLAREYLAAVEHVLGPQDGIRAVSVEYEHDRAAKQVEIKRAAEEVDSGAGVLVVTDLYGGSPSNLSMPACLLPKRRILSGVNLPMLITLARSRHLEISEAADLALDAARRYIKSVDVRGDGV